MMIAGQTLFSYAAQEALHELVSLAQARGAEDVATTLALRALRVSDARGFAVAVTALEALLARWQAAARGGLAVQEELGGYGVTERAGARYAAGFADAVTGSCSCPDFARASLGLCVHLFAVQRHQPSGPLAWTERALRWDPIRPFEGAGDWFARLASHGRADVAALLRGERRAAVDGLIALCEAEPLLAEPAVLPLLRREREVLARQEVVDPEELAAALAGMRQPLFPYQREGVARFLASGRLLLADDMGLGKTAQAIGACHALFQRGRIARALIVVPAALKPQWVREWRLFTDVPIQLVEGAPDRRARIFERFERGVVCINYEQLLKDLDAVQRMAPELVVLDEAQRIKNGQTKTAQAVKQLEPAWRLVLTGTPMENRLGELASLMEWVDETALEPQWRLSSWHARRADGAREVVGAQHLGTLRTRLAPSMLRRRRQEVLAQLPPRRDTRVMVPMTPLQILEQRELDRPIAMLMSLAQKRPLWPGEQLRLLSLLAEQRLISNGRVLRHFESYWPTVRHEAPTDALLDTLDAPKLAEVRRLVMELAVAQQRKVVVFSQWRRMLELAAWVTRDELAAAGVRAVFFTGDESRARRTENIVDFHDDPRTRVLFATDAGGVGLNLQRAASACVNLELPWNPAVLEQRVGRIYRLGQPLPIDVYNLVSAAGIEERIAALVTSKRALFTGLFDDDSDEVAFEGDGSFMRQVASTLGVDPREDDEAAA